MRLIVATTLLRIMALLPLRANHAVGAIIGWLFWVIPNRNRDNTLVNLALCYPEASSAERKQLAQRSLRETGKALTETGWLWFRPTEQIAELIDFPEQDEAFANLPQRETTLPHDSKTNSQPTLMLTPHFGAWELCPAALAPLKDPVYLYRPPRSISLEPMIKKGRERFGAEMVAVDATGLKTLLRSLRQGRPIGILPDQEPDLDNGIFANFFGVPANTMTLLPRLAAKSRARLVCLAIERKPKGKGFLVHFVPSETGVHDEDLESATSALNKTVERCIAINPAQYCWSYRRFRWQPDGSRRDYKNRLGST